MAMGRRQDGSGVSNGAAACASPPVTVAIPCFNAAPWIARTVESVLAEGYPDLTVVVVDDGSTDNSAEIVRRFGDRVRLESTANRGGCAARNLGLALADSPYVMFLDADDYVEDGLIGHLARALETSGADIALARFAAERPDGSRQLFQHYPKPPAPVDLFRDWFDRKWLPPCGMMWRAAFLRGVGGWRPNLMMNQDGELAVRAMLSAPKLTVTAEGLAIYNLHEVPSVSKLRSAAALESDIDALAEIVAKAKAGAPFAEALSGCQLRAYNLAIWAYEAGHSAVGRRAIRLAREAGLKGHLGGRQHRLISALIGLEGNIRLARVVRRLRGEALPRHTRAHPP
jgi:hypothetical protein